jgi:L-lactate dehydrogenase complex protein LldG
VERAENPGRERILSRIRSALRTPAPKHTAAASSAQIFAPIGDRLTRFQKECADNVTECMLVPDAGAAEDALRSVLASVPSGEIYLQDAPLLHRMIRGSNGGHALRWSSEGPPNEASQATVTLAESLVASHGSVLLASSGGGRGASVVAPVHIVVASESQIEPDLAAALARVKHRGLTEKNSCLFLITGSSRTADIEKILVLGAHGPRRLVVILVRDPDWSAAVLD